MLALGLGALGLVGYALAVPTPGPQHRGPLVHPIHAHADGVKMRTHGSTDLIDQDIVCHPGDQSGWHYHPGVVLVEVEGPEGGFLTFHEGCDSITNPVGSLVP